jgi:hypothetical protein
MSIDPLSVLGEALESAAETFGDATTNARGSATLAARRVKSTLSTGVYKSAYGTSYGVVFSAVFLKELLPEGTVCVAVSKRARRGVRCCREQKASGLFRFRAFRESQEKVGGGKAKAKYKRESSIAFKCFPHLPKTGG